MGIFWGYFGDILRIFWGYFWEIFGIFWGCFGDHNSVKSVRYAWYFKVPWRYVNFLRNFWKIFKNAGFGLKFWDTQYKNIFYFLKISQGNKIG